VHACGCLHPRAVMICDATMPKDRPSKERMHLRSLDSGHVLLKMGRGADSATALVEYTWPLSAFQALCVCLSIQHHSERLHAEKVHTRLATTGVPPPSALLRSTLATGTRRPSQNSHARAAKDARGGGACGEVPSGASAHTEVVRPPTHKDSARGRRACDGITDDAHYNAVEGAWESCSSLSGGSRPDSSASNSRCSTSNPNSNPSSKNNSWDVPREQLPPDLRQLVAAAVERGRTELNAVAECLEATRGTVPGGCAPR